MTAPHWDFSDAVDDLLRAHDGQPPLRPPRPIPPRPLSRHLTNPAPARRHAHRNGAPTCTAGPHKKKKEEAK